MALLEPMDIVPPESSPSKVPLAADKAPVKVPPPSIVRACPLNESLSLRLNCPVLSK